MGELKKWREQNWVRIDSEGNIVGKCGTSPDKKNPDRCLPESKARSLTKAERAATARKKKKAGKTGKTVVSNTKKATVKGMREGGAVRKEIARGCGAVLENRRKVTKHL
jgi:FKBP-type peptidyl-prolyl cis-trans isomerase|tara:strand:+ start:3419 stop:3745 length:327 start_codon:yes stop_codon:yes gene_type:complete